MHLPKFLRFGRSHPRTPSSVDSREADRGFDPCSRSGGHALSSCPSPSIGASQQGGPTATSPIGVMLGDLATQLDHAPQAVTSRTKPDNLHLAPTPSAAGSLTRSPTHPSLRTNLQSEHCDLLAVPQRSQVPATTSQQALLSPQLTLPLYSNSGTAYGAQNVSDSRNVSVCGSMNTVTYMNSVVSGSNTFMKTLLEKTIPGAAFDSSARDPPPRCHPGTRLAILDRCIYFTLNCRDEKKMRWVFGAAGVGKSAIMQSVAETPLPPGTLRASIFFFANGRSDGSKAIVTLAYQLAVECEPYRLFIEHELDHDPSLLQKSMSVQFNKFIVDPFTHHPMLNFVGRVLIIIDGLDECDNRRTQEELLRLISNLCITSPSSPLVWIIASRPEPHITSFFSRSTVEPTYEEEEILVDSNEAREDVERFLRSELTKVQTDFSLSPRVQWPSEQHFWKLAQASGGLFVYAQTVVKYIGDPDIGNPISQLDDVLKIIDAHPLPYVSRHPMAQLDALYAQILSKVPTEAKPNMRKLFLALVLGWESEFEVEGKNFIVLCNWLGITCHDAYAAIRHLFSVLKVPRRDEAHKEGFRYFHKSFIDYISDFTRSGFSPDIKQEAQQLWAQCAFRVLEQAPGDVDFGNVSYKIYGYLIIGPLVRGTRPVSNISLPWVVDEGIGWDDNRTRLYVYKMAVTTVVEGVRMGQQAFYNMFCIRFLATRFESFRYNGVQNLHRVVFDKSRRHEFIEQGLLKRVPVKMLNATNIVWCTRLRFSRPATPPCNVSGPWNPSCTHKQKGEWGKGKAQDWTTEFSVEPDALHWCEFCCQRFKHQLESWKTRTPDYTALVLFTSAGQCFVEFQVVEQEDGVSEWTYWFVHKFKGEERKALGSTV